MDAMPTFIALCLVCRLAYSVNDILVGRLARKHDQLEVAALRGVSMGVTMAPLLFWVPAKAWGLLAQRWPAFLVMIVFTGVCNVLLNHAARLLPFGLRAALISATTAIGGVAFGIGFFGERFSVLQLALAGVLVLSTVGAALGGHAAHEIQPNIPRGSLLAVAGAACLAVAALFTKHLATATDPFLTAWAWEFGSGAILLPPLVLAWRRRGIEPGLARRFLRIGAAASPTAIGSSASMLALNLGPLGLWGAIAGTQLLFSALLGVLLHRETMGWLRWLCLGAASATIAILAFTG
jgi:drug/metabolite transporter (DMT)-like permease